MKRLRARFPRRKQRQVGNIPPDGAEQQDVSSVQSQPSLQAPPQSPPPPSFPDGVKILHDCHDAVMDICFVHGLSGNRSGTWTVEGQSSPWPGTLLPPRVKQARILTYGYDAYITRRHSVASISGLSDHAKNLLVDLTNDRSFSNATSRPLVFVAHSLGGLVCKEAILLSRNNSESHLRTIFEYMKGIVFMGTPHRGSWMADWAGISSAALGIVKPNNKSLLKVLGTDDAYLQSVQDRFWSMIREQREAGRGFEVTCFFEELPLAVVGTIVSKESATLEGYNAISIHANHRNMVKFASVDDNGFKRLVGELTRWEAQIRDAPAYQTTQSMGARIDRPVGSLHRSFGSGDQFNTSGGVQNISRGNGNHFPGATFVGPVHFGIEGSRGQIQ